MRSNAALYALILLEQCRLLAYGVFCTSGSDCIAEQPPSTTNALQGGVQAVQSVVQAVKNVLPTTSIAQSQDVTSTTNVFQGIGHAFGVVTDKKPSSATTTGDSLLLEMSGSFPSADMPASLDGPDSSGTSWNFGLNGYLGSGFSGVFLSWWQWILVLALCCCCCCTFFFTNCCRGKRRGRGYYSGITYGGNIQPHQEYDYERDYYGVNPLGPATLAMAPTGYSQVPVPAYPQMGLQQSMYAGMPGSHYHV
jgi:hypothetical protein